MSKMCPEDKLFRNESNILQHYREVLEQEQTHDETRESLSMLTKKYKALWSKPGFSPGFPAVSKVSFIAVTVICLIKTGTFKRRWTSLPGLKREEVLMLLSILSLSYFLYWRSFSSSRACHQIGG